MASIPLLRVTSLFKHLKGIHIIQFQRHECTDLIREAFRQREKIMMSPISVSHCQFGKSFSSNNLDVFDFVRDKEGNVIHHYDFKHDDENLVFYNTQLDKLFADGLEHIDSFLSTGKCDVPYMVPLSALSRFFENKDENEQSLKSLAEVRNPEFKETDISAVLAIHLISPLLIETRKEGYIISLDSKEKPKYCPCGSCKNSVTYGNTEFGSSELWYGKPDVMAFPLGTGKVSIATYSKKKDYKTMYGVEEDKEKSIMKVKTHPRSLEQENNISKFVKQAITFSFYQKVFQKQKKVPESEIISLIPTMAFCSDGFSIYMYDHVHDIFLRSNCLPLWKDTDPQSLNLNTVIMFWMLLNHLSFKPRLTENIVNVLDGSCGIRGYITSEKMQKIEKSLTAREAIIQRRSIKFPRRKNVVTI